MSNPMEQHIAWWNGFSVAMGAIDDILTKHKFDFTGCTTTKQICDLIKKVIKDETKSIRECHCGDHK